ncbi:MAG: hypothetical protein R3B99_17590 [Polyangiales bacterium]
MISRVDLRARRQGYGPELVAWLGRDALLRPRRARKRLVRTRVDVEATLFLLALFVMVGVVRRAGLRKRRQWLDQRFRFTGLQLDRFSSSRPVCSRALLRWSEHGRVARGRRRADERLPAPAVYVGRSPVARNSLFLRGDERADGAGVDRASQGLRCERQAAAIRLHELLQVGYRWCDLLGVGIGWALVLARWAVSA